MWRSSESAASMRSMRARGVIVKVLAIVAVTAGTVSLAACTSAPRAPMPTVSNVDLPRYMGDWYVIASIPTRFEVGAHNAVEHYRLDPDGTVFTRFTFRAGGFDGKLKSYDSRGYVVDRDTNAIWGIQFLWPFKADYRIVFLDSDYRHVVVAREKRDYAWIMARDPKVDEGVYAQMVERLADLGYDVTKLQPVPQRWQP
ncbi:MAG: lipocalin family protein [Gammaproteobacteria bacterium]